MLVKPSQLWSNLIKLGQTRFKLVLFGTGHYSLTMAGTGKRSPAARCSRVKNTPLCSPPNVDSSALSINRRSMLYGTSQYAFSSSIVRDEMMLLVEGVARRRPLGWPLLEVSSRPSPFYKQIKRRGENEY